MKPIKPLPSLETALRKFRFPQTTVFANELKSKTNNQITLNGWIHRKPRQVSKSLTFADLRDEKGNLVQLIDQASPSALKGLKPDSVVSVVGTVSPNAASEKVDLSVSGVQVLNEANLVPGELLAEKTSNWPGQYRYIQLRQPDQQALLRARSSILKTCRSVLEENDFVEVETPLLFKSTPEGAREFLVPTRKQGLCYALPQSPQQYKQILIASGIDRYYQIAKCFRDEDLRQDRQPEFTQLDLEMGFAGSSEVQGTIHKIVERVWRNHGKSVLKTPVDPRCPAQLKNPETAFSKLTYNDAIRLYGVDKPDLRNDLQIKTLPATSKVNPEFSVAECLVLGDVSDEAAAPLFDPKEYKARVPLKIRYESPEQFRTELQNVCDFDSFDEVLASVSLHPGDLLVVGDRRELNYENPTPLGRARQLAMQHLPHCAPKPETSVAIWVHEFPLFEPNEKGHENGYPVYDFDTLSSSHHPFTMVDLEDYNLLHSDPLSCRGYHFDLVVDGVELGGGSTRVHDVNVQLYILKQVLKIGNAEQLFGHLLGALAAGCPPHAGLAIGFDRFVAMLLGRERIRDVIAFPKTVNGADIMMGSPSRVRSEQLHPYHLRIV